MDFGQHSILITGASSGIGRALAIAFHGEGARVLAAGRDASRLARLAEDHKGIATIAADLADPMERARFLAEVTARAGDLSILVNNAGVQYPADHIAVDDAAAWAVQVERANAEIALNCIAAVEVTLGLLPRLKTARAAAVVFVSSGLALAPKASAPVYCATKAFVRSFAKSLRYQCEEHAPHVQVLDILPPMVDTPMTAGRGRGKISPEIIAQATLSGLCKGSQEVFVGKVRLLRWVQRVSPGIAERIVRGA